MIHTFSSREEAAIFASAMRSDGYYADILDEGMGSIYGPLAIGGIRVVVSDEPLADTLDESGASGKVEDGEFLKTLRLSVVGVVVLGLALIGIMLLSITSQDPAGLARLLYHALKYPLLLALAFAVLGPLMEGFTHWLRGESSGEGQRYLRWLLLALLIPLLLLLAW
jgi:hypothetical protein